MDGCAFFNPIRVKTMMVSSYSNSAGSDGGLHSQYAKTSPSGITGGDTVSLLEKSMIDLGTGLPGRLSGNYLMLISRLENGLKTGSVDSRDTQRLQLRLQQKFSTLTTALRRRLDSLPEYEALQSQSLLDLATSAERRLAKPESAAAILAFLKHRAMVAVMKDETAVTVYGPGGVVKAS